MAQEVARAPDVYELLLPRLSKMDERIYNLVFVKTCYGAGNAAAFERMLVAKAALQNGVSQTAGRPLDRDCVQPERGLLELTMLVRSRVPTFVLLVTGMISGVGGVTAKFRARTKAFFRMVEKAILKGPRTTGPDVDCSKILDVAGCLVLCSSYDAMTLVLEAALRMHAAGELVIVRIKDRWSDATAANGWRDLMLNIVVDGVYLEIQVAHALMFTARGELGGHDSYNKFRCFSELLAYVRRTDIRIPVHTSVMRGVRASSAPELGESAV